MGLFSGIRCPARFWSRYLAEILKTFLTLESNVGLFFLVGLAALTLGLLVTLFRWVLFEKWICKEVSFKPEDFKNLKGEPNLLAFRAVVDEHYRCHQFWGGMFLVHFILYPSLIYKYWKTLELVTFLVSLIVFIAIEAMLFMGAKVAYENYLSRAKNILEGNDA